MLTSCLELYIVVLFFIVIHFNAYGCTMHPTSTLFFWNMNLFTKHDFFELYYTLNNGLWSPQQNLAHCFPSHHASSSQTSAGTHRNGKALKCVTTGITEHPHETVRNSHPCTFGFIDMYHQHQWFPTLRPGDQDPNDPICQYRYLSGKVFHCTRPKYDNRWFMARANNPGTAARTTEINNLNYPWFEWQIIFSLDRLGIHRIRSAVCRAHFIGALSNRFYIHCKHLTWLVHKGIIILSANEAKSLLYFPAQNVAILNSTTDGFSASKWIGEKQFCN